jgi:cell division transport system ATP-binding protein
MIYLTGLVGSGKSTLLSSMYGNTPIHKGQAMVLGNDMKRIKSSKLQSLRRQIGIVHQELRLLSDRTIYENLDFVLRATDWDKKSLRKERIEEVLEWVKLSDTTKCYPHELSGGQKQCICVARAMLNHPELILADEPTGQLDAESGERVMALLDEIRRRANCTLVISTHNLQWPEIFPGTTYTCENGILVRNNMTQQQLL